MTRKRTASPWLEAIATVLLWLTASALAFVFVDRATAIGWSAGSALALGIASVAAWARERKRWTFPTARLSDQVMALAMDPRGGVEFWTTPRFRPLIRAIEALADRVRANPQAGDALRVAGDSGVSGLITPMTRSGLFEAPSGVHAAAGDSNHSGEWNLTDMVNRLDPVGFHWIESSLLEQAFFGWSLRELRARSFLEVVHEEDQERARGQFRSALEKGESHGLVLRVRTARGKLRAVSVDVAARYDVDLQVSHLRCHLTDVTAKLRADRILKQRTRELLEVNARLIEANRQLEEIKEVYRDLYQNAPAMYFSLDHQGRFLECNETLLQTLGLPRSRLIGQSYETLLVDSLRAQFADRFSRFLQEGVIEVESRWVKEDGTEIDVSVKGLALHGADGQVIRSRSVAQEITAQKRLESELRDKNVRLALANEELLRRNKEMDEFLYVVSHDLQEPLRTLVSFSDFLLADYGERLDDQGKEFVHYLVDASRRMRALIQDLTTLSRAGRVTRDFAPVKLNEVLKIVRADLSERIRSRGGVVEFDPELPDVWGDRDRIIQLFTNLISNGLKYNRESVPRVVVGREGAAGGASGWVTVAVRDNGIGIDPAYHAKIFQLFRRLHTQEEYEGTGAGLAICQKIVHAHGGSIQVLSELNRGAVFLVKLRTPPEGQ